MVSFWSGQDNAVVSGLCHPLTPLGPLGSPLDHSGGSDDTVLMDQEHTQDWQELVLLCYDVLK